MRRRWFYGLAEIGLHALAIVARRRSSEQPLWDQPAGGPVTDLERASMYRAFFVRLPRPVQLCRHGKVVGDHTRDALHQPAHRLAQ